MVPWFFRLVVAAGSCWLLAGCAATPAVVLPTPVVTDSVELASIVDSVRRVYAPDKRVALLQVTTTTTQPVVLRGETNLPYAKAQLLQALAQRGYRVLDSVAVLPGGELAGKTYGIVRQSVANIRSAGQHSAELATQATLGTPLRIYKRVGDWAYVQTPDGYLGWLDTGGFIALDSTAFDRWQRADRVVYQPDYGLARAYPLPYSQPIGDLLAGNILERTDSFGLYTQVIYPDSTFAYILTEELAEFSGWAKSRSPDQRYIFATAEQLMGRPYLWGGTSGKGLDCSGFTKTVYFLNGLIIPRDASQQVHAGTEVPIDSSLTQLRAGDFVFFGNYRADGSERISHVGIYLGEGRFVHSGADNGAVRVQSLRRGDADFAEHRLQSLLRARRYQVGQTGIQRLRDSHWYFARP